jgi:hypothetical protein
MNRRTLVVPALAFTLAACGGRPTHSSYDYSLNTVEAQKRVQACDKFLAIREHDADCVNALAGLHIAALRPSPLDPSK